MTPTQPIPPPSPSLSVSDISYIVFRHKWKILICTVLGLAAAGVAYKMRKPMFQSDAKLYIRYVLSDQQAGPLGSKEGAKSPDQRGETIMSSEMEILTSADLAKQVAEAIGPEKILAKAGGGKDPVLAADLIRKGLNVDVPYRSSVIHISFKHQDSDVVQPVLRQLVESYLKMHRDVHQALGISGDFITQETDQLRARLAQTEQDLQKTRIKAGIYSSIEDAKRTNAEQIATVRLQLFNVQAELAARLSAKAPAPAKAAGTAPATTSTAEAAAAKDAPAAAKAAPAAPAEPPAAAEPPKAKIDEYAAVVTRIETLNKAHNQLLLQFTPENPRVAEVRAQITTAEEQRQKLEQEFPALGRARVTPTATAPVMANAPAADPAAEIAALQAKVNVLNAQLEQLTNDANKVADVEVAIAELRRRRDMDEANYRRFAERLEQIRLDESSGAGRVSNISVVEAATFPSVDAGKAGKVIGGIAIAGLAIGLAWALAIELYIDRSIKRPVDVERNFRMPLFLSLPELKELRGAGNRRQAPGRLQLEANGKEPKPTIPEALVAENNPLRVYHETLRDRLIGFFESVNLTHKPKLVAVTSVGPNAGVTTTAAGLSQSLSEIGEGNVLLVDMTAGQGSAQQFLKGKPVSDLDDVLAARSGGQVQENLYVVTADSNSEKLSRNLPQRFTKLVPKLKASDFDYIIFDLPPVSQISITPRLAGFMDMVLLVVESEKTDRDLLDRATKLLGQSKTHVGAVLNKTRNYGPSRKQTELLCGM